MSNSIWITWERQRRSQELAKHFGCSFFEIVHHGALRYPVSVFRTLWVLLRTRPATLFVQNPSMILATLAVAWGAITSTFVVVDRHTTFLLNRHYRLSPGLILFKLLHRLTLRFADITVVTNDHLAELVREAGGRPYVLQDKLPETACGGRNYPLPEGNRTVLLISSFGEDEPIREVVEAIGRVQTPLHLFVSGNTANAPADLVQQPPENLTFTGFLSDDEYLNLLCSVDIVAVLTTADYTMLCGCYEAVSAERPLITSDKQVLREYFRGATFVENTPASIAAAFDRSVDEIADSRRRIADLRVQLEQDWLERADGLVALVEQT